MDTQENRKLIERTLHKYQLCDSCLGRLFRYGEKGIINKKRGELIRDILNLDKKVSPEDCWLCEGLFNEIDLFANLISKELKRYEFNTFLVGSKIDDDILEKEQELLDFTKSDSVEPIKMEINREVGKILEKKLQKQVDFENPDIIAIIDTAFNVVTLQIKSLFIYGRYKKFERGIPQTKWPCRICRGKGCRACNYNGKMYQTSVEELISKKALEITKGDNVSFHGSGREDIDAKCLDWRPFVIEIIEPKKRRVNLKKIEKQINKSKKIKVKILKFSDKNTVRRIKSERGDKTYRVLVKLSKPTERRELRKLKDIVGIINQRTPIRVSHRRADLIRKRRVKDMKYKQINKKTLANYEICQTFLLQ